MEQIALLVNEIVWPLCLQVKFIDEVDSIVRKSRRLVLTKDEGWYSEAEMKNELKWSALGHYQT